MNTPRRVHALAILTGLLGATVLLVSTATSGDDTGVAAAGTEAGEPPTHSNRAFHTAPPVIPHLVHERGARECLHCHSDIRTIQGQRTVIAPHAEFSNCQQCHVGAQAFNEHFPFEEAPNDWVGLEEPGRGDRANELAPPTIPHRLFLREKCLTCHAPNHREERMRVRHAERTQCLQCHVADARWEF